VTIISIATTHMMYERNQKVGSIHHPSCVPLFVTSVLYACLPPTAAYKYADGKKIDSKRVVVDVERGRTVKSWKPRRLGAVCVLCVCVRACSCVVHVCCVCVCDTCMCVCGCVCVGGVCVCVCVCVVVWCVCVCVLSYMINELLIITLTYIFTW